MPVPAQARLSLLDVAIPLSGVLAAWTNAWLSGRASSDDALSAVAGLRPGAAHRVVGLPGVQGPQPLSAVLIEWRLQGLDAVAAALPVPGDVRGLPDHATLRAAALAAGEAAIGGSLALVPNLVGRAASSAPDHVIWQAFPEVWAAPDEVWLGDAEHDLTDAIRQSASALALAQTARWRPELGVALGAARGAADHLPLPPGHPQRAVRMLAQAERLAAMLDIADPTGPGDAVDRCAMDARAQALAPLATAVRRARLAGYNAPDLRVGG
jgi:hypothetical protein